MAEQTFQQTGTGRQTGQGSSKGGSGGQKTLRDQAADAGRELKEKVTDFAEASGETLKEQASEVADAAKDMASQATHRLKDTISEQKGAGAEYIGTLAETMRRAAREFDSDLPVAGKYIRKAAVQIDQVSDSIRTGDLNDLIDGAQSFARRQPAAFLGLAALAGFVAVRFLKSSPGSGSVSARRRSGGQAERSHSEYRGQSS